MILRIQTSSSFSLVGAGVPCGVPRQSRQPKSCCREWNTLTPVLLIFLTSFPELNQILQVFNSGFAEATESVMSFCAREADDGYAAAASPAPRPYADSDDEDDDTMLDTDDDQSMAELSDGETTHSRIPTAPSVLSTNLTEDESDACLVETDTTEPRNVRQKVTHPSSPRRTTATALSAESPTEKYPPRPMTRVVVRDASYSAYRSVLHYVSIHDIQAKSETQLRLF